MRFSIRDIILGRRFRGSSRRGGGSPSRIYGPTDLEDTFLIEEVEDKLIPVVAKIQNLYGKVEDPARRNGFCFGLLDPISNIVVSSTISAAVPSSEPRALAEGGRRHEGQIADMAARSLSGLIAFLTCLFPYLPEEEALGYLGSAGADPVVACLLIIRRRGMRDFDPCSLNATATIETALRCAAVAAQHPDPQQLVLGWKLLSPDLYMFPFSYDTGSRIQGVTMTLLNMVHDAGTTDDPGIVMDKSWYYAQIRLRSVRFKELPPARAAMKRMLLAMIHGFYLQALAKLPTTELCSQYHRSMLMGGYCYGPLDPVSNIIINTLWYEQRFPLTSRDLITLRMMSTKCLWRIAARSLYGLVSFLCTRYPALTPDLAMQRLLVAKADLRAADPNLPPVDARQHFVPVLDWSGCYQVGSGATSAKELQLGAVDSRTPSTTTEKAYAAAAAAVFHPDPCAQKELLGSPSATPALVIASQWLQQGHVLSAQDVLFLSQLFRCPSISELDQQQQPVRRKKAWYTFASDCRGRFWDQHERVCSKVKAALDAYNEGKELKYTVHVICGVNEFVSGPEFCKGEESRGYNPWTPFKYHYSHINFLATCGGSKPTLFFAECPNHETDKVSCISVEPLCIPVEPMHPVAEYVRCIYCEYEGNRIVHPAVKGFHGRGVEFEKVLRGEPLFHGADKDLYINNRIITDKQEEVDWVHSVTDDYIYSVNYSDDAPADSADEDDYRLYIPFD